jgi:two-component system sensor histidine kinase HydH
MGAALILGLVVLIMAARDTRKEKERMTQQFTERAAALIWALEAGSRTRMAIRAGNPYLQLLLEETAKQPGIVYMAVTDGEGNILAHSERTESIVHFADPESIAALDVSDSLKWRIVDGAEGVRIFEAYASFSPIAGLIRGQHGHEGRGDTPFRRDIADLAPEEGRVIFAGLDARPFEEALETDFRGRVLNSLLVALVAFCAFVSLFWAHNYRTSRRMLQDAEAFAADLQQQLRRSERLSALGNLAAGVAHEVRNPLSSIKGFATLLLGKAEKEGDADAARMLIQEVDRLNRVVSGLLEFARPDTVRLAPTRLASVVEQALRLCASDAASQDIAVRFTPGADLPLVAADADKLAQALLNLFLNAIQAMDRGGALEISSGRDPATDKILLRIADTGKGIAPEALSSIFDPYVTGRASGTGLGLAIVHRIVEQHGGVLRVESKPGRGSVFCLSLRAAESADAA